MNDDVFRLVRVDDTQDAGKDELLDNDGVARLDHHLERLADRILTANRHQQIKVDFWIVNRNLFL